MAWVGFLINYKVHKDFSQRHTETFLKAQLDILLFFDYMRYIFLSKYGLLDSLCLLSAKSLCSLQLNKP